MHATHGHNHGEMFTTHTGGTHSTNATITLIKRHQKQEVCAADWTRQHPRKGDKLSASDIALLLISLSLCAFVAVLAWMHSTDEDKYLDEKLYEKQPLIFVGKEPPMMTDLELSNYERNRKRDKMELYFG